jgi:hypothetical protein
MSEALRPRGAGASGGKKSVGGSLSAGTGPDSRPFEQPLESCGGSIHLVHESPPSECHFWIGFNRPGILSPAELLKTQDVGSILRQSAESGTNESGNLLLTNIQDDIAKYFLLVPKPASLEEGLASWIDGVLSALTPWTPNPVGLYLSDRNLTEDVQSEVIQALVQELFLKSACRKIFLLCGPQGLNFLLSIALEIRAVLAHRDFSVDVYH